MADAVGCAVVLKQDSAYEKAQLQWTLEEVRVIRYGTVQRLVEALASDTGDLDSSYVNTFLETYRTFSLTPDVMHHLLNWLVMCFLFIYYLILKHFCRLLAFLLL